MLYRPLHRALQVLMRCVRVVVVCPKQCFRPCVTTWMPHPPSRPRHNARSTVLLVTGILEICHIVTIPCVQYGLSTVYPSGGAILTSLAVWYPRLSRTIGIWTGCSTDSISDRSPSITLTDAAPMLLSCRHITRPTQWSYSARGVTYNAITCRER